MIRKKLQSLCSLLMPSKNTGYSAHLPSRAPNAADNHPAKKNIELLYHRDIKINRSAGHADNANPHDWLIN